MLGTRYHTMSHLFQCDFPKVQNGSEVLRKSLKLLGKAKPSYLSQTLFEHEIFVPHDSNKLHIIREVPYECSGYHFITNFCMKL